MTVWGRVAKCLGCDIRRDETAPRLYRIEQLEDRCLLATLMLDPGEAAVDTVSGEFFGIGYSQTGRGEWISVGHRSNADTGVWEGVARVSTYYLESSLEAELLGLGGNTYALAISQLATFAGGFSDPPEFTEGTLWDLSVLPNPVPAVGFGGRFQPGHPRASSFLGGVSNDGIGVGGSDGGIPVQFDVTNGLRALPGGRVGFADGVTADGSLAVGWVGRIPNTIGAVTFSSDGMEFLEDPFGIQSLAREISPLGEFIGGYIVTAVDPITFEGTGPAAYWQNGALNVITDGDGNPFIGETEAVTDIGWMGGSSPAGAWIYHPDNAMFADGPRLVSEFIAAQFTDADGGALSVPQDAGSELVSLLYESDRNALAGVVQMPGDPSRAYRRSGDPRSLRRFGRMPSCDPTSTITVEWMLATW